MANRAFRRRSRLLKPADFKRVFEQAVVSSDPYFRVLARAGDTPGPRLGMAVSRKVDSRAVARNRIKRLIRESFRNSVLATHAGRVGADTGCDIVVLARAAASQASNTQLSASLRAHWAGIERKMAGECGGIKSGNP